MPTARLVAALALVDDLVLPTRVLAARRTAPVALAGQWEFPGGKVEADEDPVAAARREVWEELGVRVRVGELLAPPGDGDWPLAPPLSMRLWWAVVTSGEPRPMEDHDELRWLGGQQLDDVPWLLHDRPVVEHLKPMLHPPPGGMR